MSMTTDSSHSTTDAASAFDIRRSAAPRPEAERAEALAAPRFGTVFTDHMARISWSQAGGWHDRRVEAYGPLQIDPACAVLHYAQEIFEGLKAYRHGDGSVWTFRPWANAARFAASARRLALHRPHRDAHRAPDPAAAPPAAERHGAPAQLLRQRDGLVG